LIANHYEKLYDRYKQGLPMLWSEWFEKEGYISANAMRNQFRRERIVRGDAARINDDIQAAILMEDRLLDLPKIGVMDIEILPGIKYFWSYWDDITTSEKVIHEYCFLSWAGKYLDDDQMHSDILTPEEVAERDPSRIVQSAYEFLEKCEIIIGHNWRSYDGKILNTYFLKHKKPVIRPRQVDTLEVAKSNFRFPSNKLKDINKELGIRDKVDNEGFPLWVRCSIGDENALSEMLNYNIGDILSTEELFWTFQPYIHNLPNFQTYRGEEDKGCHCGSYNLKQEGTWVTNTARYEKFRCLDCGALMRGKKNLLDKEQRGSLLVRL
jgi:DNA polymerase III epsilon subunit-like protein